MQYCFDVVSLTLSTSIFLISGVSSAWWDTSVLYQVYPRSFKDSDGDGVGDLNGITENANYLKELGVEAIWMSPIYKSPMVDMGYDIMDFYEIDPLFGTLSDFDKLIAKLKVLDIKVILDFVPNHCSDQHPWFRSALNTSDPHHDDYNDFFIWREPSGWNGTTPLPPNNWISVFDESPWTWSEKRQLFYFHQFLSQQPDLNYRNEKVFGNMTDIMRFWLDKGVDGFRMDAPMYLVENKTFANQSAVPGTAGNTFATQMHNYSTNQPETFQLMTNFSKFLQQQNLKDGVDRLMLLEVYSDDFTIEMKYYGGKDDTLSIPFNFDMVFFNQDTRATEIKGTIDKWMNALPEGKITIWVIGSHDQPRVSFRCGPEMVDAMNLLSGVLPGSQNVYNGDEIGMLYSYVPPDLRLDPSRFRRDGSRTPLQWDDSDNAGFSTNQSTWLPVDPGFWQLNVEAQRSAQTSHLKVMQALFQAKKDPVLTRGNLTVLAPDNNTLVVIRQLVDECFVLLINVGVHSRTYTSQNLFTAHDLDLDMTVFIGSINSGLKPGTALRRGSIAVKLRPKAAVLLRSRTSKPEPSSASPTGPGTGLVLMVLVVLNAISNM